MVRLKYHSILLLHNFQAVIEQTLMLVVWTIDFDEAFNNMDESRIDAMMKFYNSLSIQLFIAVPPQRVSNIVNYVTTSLAIVKDNDFAIVEAFKREVI